MTIRSLIDAAIRPMNKDESEMFINAMMAKQLQTKFDEKFSQELGFSGQVLERRLSTCSTVTITKGLALFIVVTSNGNPGNLVMWAYTLHKMNKGEMLTIHDFTNSFPMGVPSEEGYTNTWDKQKDQTNGGNLIDNKDNWN